MSAGIGTDPVNKWDRLRFGMFAVLEGLAVFSVAFGLYIYHNFLSGAPNLSLIFDAQAFLSAAHGIQGLLGWHLPGQALGFCLHGMSELERLQIRNLITNTEGAMELLHTGPVLPFLLGVSMSFAGKTATNANWQYASIVMMLTQSVCVLAVYLAAWLGYDRATARVAAVLSLVSLPFIINSGRPMSEIPAACCVAIWTLSFFFLVRTLRQNGRGPEEKNEFQKGAGQYRQWFASCLFGVASAILPMVRTNLSLLPFIAICLVLALYGRKLAGQILRLSIPFAISFFMVLSPWMLFQGLVTGSYSPLVDRYGSYNLSVGCNLEMDGLDVLPGTYVAHPDRFKQPIKETLSQVITESVRHPWDFVGLFLRKICRLYNSPWNDFEISCLGVPWSWQVFIHQWLLLVCCLGFLTELTQAAQDRSAPRSCNVLLLGIIVGYQVLNCLFIAMRRYFFPAVPAVIMLAAVAMRFRLGAGSRKDFILLLLATLLPPATCMSINWLSGEGAPALPGLAVALDVPLVANLAALIMALAIFVWALLTMRVAGKSRPARIALWAITVPACLAAFQSTANSMMALGFPIAVNSRRGPVTVNLRLPEWKNHDLWFLVMDVVGSRANNSLSGVSEFPGASDLPGASALPCPSDLAVSINGKQVSDKLEPWFSFDLSSRENYLFETAFAYCSGVEIDQIRQWKAMQIPESLLRFGSDNSVGITVNEAQTGSRNNTIFVLADIWNRARKLNHCLSLRRFSWTKGFFMDPVGDMRMDEWVDHGFFINPVVNMRMKEGGNLASSSSGKPSMESGIFLKPRVYLVSVASPVPLQNEPGEGKSGNRPFEFPRDLAYARVGTGINERVVSKEVFITGGLQDIAPEERSFNAVEYLLNGKLRCVNGRGMASVGLVEKNPLATEPTQFAANGPLYMRPGPQWSSFEFRDRTPLASVNPISQLSCASTCRGALHAPGRIQSAPTEQNDNQKPSSTIVPSVLLLLSSRPWWDVLSYGQLKGTGTIEFKDVHIEARPSTMADLSRNAMKVYDGELSSAGTF